MFGYQGPPISEERAQLAAAAPAVVLALLDVEFDADGNCPHCWKLGKHDEGNCTTDDALTLAGLDTRDKRDALRAEVEKRRKLRSDGGRSEDAGGARRPAGGDREGEVEVTREARIQKCNELHNRASAAREAAEKALKSDVKVAGGVEYHSGTTLLLCEAVKSLADGLDAAANLLALDV